MDKVPLHDHSPASLYFAAQSWTPSQLADELAEAANSGDGVAAKWLERLKRYGITDALVRELKAVTHDISIPWRIRYDNKRRKFVWSPDLLLDNGAIPSLDAAYALLVVTLIQTDQIGRLEKCALNRCGKYFFGDPRSRWCSETCGSYFRVYQKRNGQKRATKELL